MPGATVRFGPIAGSNVVVAGNGLSLTVVVPPSAVTGPVPIVVQNTNGTTAVSNTPFTYTFAAPVSAPAVPANGLNPDHGPVTGGTAITITGTQLRAGGDGDGRRRAGDRRPGAQQHADRRGDAGRRRRAVQRRRDDHDGDLTAADVHLRSDGRADPHLQRHRHRRRRHARRVGDPVRVQPRRRRPTGRSTPTATASCNNGQMHGVDAPARQLHALPGGRRDRTVLRHPHRPRQSGGRRRRASCSASRRTRGPVVRHYPRRPGASRAGPSTSGSLAGLEAGQHLDGRRVRRAGRGRSHDALGSRDRLRRARRNELAGAVADVVPRRRRDAGQFDAVLPDPEPERDAGGAGQHPLPAADRRRRSSRRHTSSPTRRHDRARRRAARARRRPTCPPS